MARHRSPGGQIPSPVLATALNGSVTRVRGSHRLPPPPSALRGRVVVAAVAAGAFAAATAGPTLQSFTIDTSDADVTPLANAYDGVGGGAAIAAAPKVLPQERAHNALAEVKRLTASKSVTEARKEREAEAARKAREEAMRPKTVLPALGQLTSGFGARWGTNHNGIDIAAPLGTPIVAAADGVVIEAGSASGFGMWVRVQHDDGTVTVYGHMYEYSVSEGQQVKAGEQIATVGSNGQSTGPHLHFEVWQGGGAKIDPLSWLSARGVSV